MNQYQKLIGIYQIENTKIIRNILAAVKTFIEDEKNIYTC